MVFYFFRYAVIDRDAVANPNKDLVEFDDHIEIGEIVFNKPFVEKPVSAEDHNIYVSILISLFFKSSFSNLNYY